MSKIVKADGYNEVFNGGAIQKPFYAPNIGEDTLSRFYESDGIARKIIDVVPEDIVSSGFKISGVDDELEFKSTWDEKRLNEKIIDALCWSRLYGGSVILAMVNDGRMLKTPVKQGSELEDIRVYDRFQVRVSKKETNPRNVRYGEPLIYTISPGGDAGEFDVHYSRVVVIDGERVPNSIRRRNDGWGASILNERLIQAIGDYNRCEELATQLLRRKQQAVWKARGLADLCDDNEGEMAARLRLAQIDDDSGVGRAIGIDSVDEDYTVLNSDISGVDAFLQSKFDRIVALSGIHEIVLKNKNTGGVSASQNTALETYHKMIDRKREEDYRPILEFLLPFLIKEQEWSIEFNPLSIPSEKDVAETMNKNVDSITKLVDSQLMDTKEARDTMRSLGSLFKISDSDSVQIEETEPEPTNELENNI